MKNNFTRIVYFLAIAVLPISACTKEPFHRSTPANATMAESIGFEFAVYYLPTPTNDPLETLKHEAAAEVSELNVVEKIPETPLTPMVHAHLERDIKNNYPPPDIKALQYFGRGLSKEQAQTLQDSGQALILDFAHPKKDVWNALHSANELVENIARKTNGLIWDAETREVFTPDEWHTIRLASWKSGIPIVARQTTIHAYKNTEFIRAITLGMTKIGLPDVVVDDFPWSSNRQVGDLINDLCQVMAEGASFGPHGEFDLNIKAIQNPTVRDAELQSTKANATSVAQLTLEQATPEEGDPANRIIQISAERYPGSDMHVKQETMFSSMYGSEDSISRIKHTDALLKASEEARTKLPALKRAFQDGLQPDEFILVKAPFATPKGGQEWMWVEVASWKDTSINGLLQNDPFDIPTLHAGQMVEVDERKIFDYIRQLPNGTREGNETSKIIEQMDAQQKN